MVKAHGIEDIQKKVDRTKKEISCFISANSFLIVVVTGCFNRFDLYKSFTLFLAYFHLDSDLIFSNTIAIGIDNRAIKELIKFWKIAV